MRLVFRSVGTSLVPRVFPRLCLSGHLMLYDLYNLRLPGFSWFNLNWACPKDPDSEELKAAKAVRDAAEAAESKGKGKKAPPGLVLFETFPDYSRTICSWSSKKTQEQTVVKYHVIFNCSSFLSISFPSFFHHLSVCSVPIFWMGWWPRDFCHATGCRQRGLQRHGAHGGEPRSWSERLVLARRCGPKNGRGDTWTHQLIFMDIYGYLWIFNYI